MLQTERFIPSPTMSTPRKPSTKTSPTTTPRNSMGSPILGDYQRQKSGRYMPPLSLTRSRPESSVTVSASIASARLGITSRKLSTVQKLNLAIDLFNSRHYKRAYPLFEELAKTKNIPAMYHKAVMTFDGLGTNESAREGLLTMKQVYDESTKSGGDPEYRHLACYQVGLAYTRGAGARQDHREAVKWWLRAATEVKYNPSAAEPIEKQLVTDAGTKCQVMLAQHYSELRPPEYDKCYFWYKEAAQNGSVESMLQVALMTWYDLGCQLGKDERNAVIRRYLTQAASSGNICAMGNLSMYCLQNQLQEEAYQWASKVIETIRVSSTTTLGEAVSTITASPNNDNDEEGIVKSIGMSYFVLAHLHNVGGASATLDKTKAMEFYETACGIDIYLVQALNNLLEDENQLK